MPDVTAIQHGGRPALLPLHDATRYAERALLYFCVLAAALSIWVVRYPPMGDLPQHAAQVSLALDLLRGQSRWTDIVTFNFFTPYLIGYGLIALAAQLTSIATAVKLVLSLSVLGFFWAASALRRRFGAPALLDWLVLPGFFGFAFKWGFLTFLLAAPIGIFFILKALDFAEETNPKRLLQLLACGLLLFFSHGLVFVACVGIGFCYALLDIRDRRHAFWRLLPYALLGLLALVYYHFAKDVAYAQSTEAKPFVWNWSPRRFVQFFRFQWDVALSARDRPGYLLSAFAFALFYLAPFLLGMRLRPTLRRAIPFAVIVLIGLGVPHMAMTTAFLYERFALFLLPFYVLMFGPADEPSTVPAGWSLFTLAALPAISLAMTASRAWQFHKFDEESQDFSVIMDALPPQKRVLSLMLDKRSTAAANPYAYLHFACWYQAEKHGFVDSNFAQMLPQIVRFKPGEAWIQLPFEWKPYRFDWVRHRGDHYDYFVLRSEKRLFPRFAGMPCDIELVTTSGPWALYRKLPDTCSHAAQLAREGHAGSP